MTVELSPPIRHWKCPSCSFTDTTRRYDLHSLLHVCPALNNASVPMEEVRDLDDNTVSRHVVVEREDYIGSEVGVTNVAGVKTERPDGSNDMIVYPGTATLDVGA